MPLQVNQDQAVEPVRFVCVDCLINVISFLPARSSLERCIVCLVIHEAIPDADEYAAFLAQRRDLGARNAR